MPESELKYQLQKLILDTDSKETGVVEFSSLEEIKKIQS